MSLQRTKQLVGRKKEILRRQHRVSEIAAQYSMTAARVLPERFDRARHAGVDADRCIRRQVIGDTRGVLEEERQVVLDAGRRDALRDILVDTRARRIAFESLAEVAPKPRLPGIVHGKFTGRQKPYLVYRVNAALGIHIEAAYRFDLVIEQIDAVGQCA